jgi:cyclopropane-fatty-acyl-phospholipid synthase
MSLLGTAINTVERLPLPDLVTRAGVDALCGLARRNLAAPSPDVSQTFARDMGRHVVAEHADAANRQHYELPPEFFGLILGPHRKYSCCLYPTGTETLAEAELAALADTVAHAGLADGQQILELGCGWGSLTLFMAARYPRATITAVSNSRPQREHIMRQAVLRELTNVEVITADMNAFEAPATYDRIVSVEMFEHMSNWPALLGRVRSWLRPEGRFFMHVFTHRAVPYRFDEADDADWIGQHFFTGGIMPSHDLIHQFPELLEVEDEWVWNGQHYRRTAEQWLENFDANRAAIDAILRDVYGSDAALWRRRWRLFFLATAGLFGHAHGTEWAVSHYRMKAV